ncbi:10876_t:CDS:2, partial [Rhizophagus irregularis]
YLLTSSEIPYNNYCYYPIISDLSTISDVSISSISNALSNNNNSSEIPYDNYCYYPITSDLSTISDVSISLISNALSNNNNSSEIPYDNYCYDLITSDLSTNSDASISDAISDATLDCKPEQSIIPSSHPTDHKHKIQIFTLESLTDLLNGVQISFDGNHNDMTQSWSQEELNVRRR